MTACSWAFKVSLEVSASDNYFIPWVACIRHEKGTQALQGYNPPNDVVPGAPGCALMPAHVASSRWSR